MGRGPIFFDKARGKVGNVVLSVNKGQQISRAYTETNSSKGNGATYAQRLQRVMLANVINAYRMLRASEILAFSAKDPKQSDYNAFVQANLPGAKVPMTKKVAEKGSVVVQPFQLSKGVLGECQVLSDSSTTLIWGADVSTLSTFTIGQLSQNIITGNPALHDGDLLTLVFAYVDSGVVRSVSYEQFKLDTTSAALASTQFVLNVTTSIVAGEPITVNGTVGQDLSIGLIITRVENGKVVASNSALCLADGTVPSTLTDAAAVKAAMKSYGYDQAPLLDPRKQNA